MNDPPTSVANPESIQQDSKGAGTDSRFSCNICLEAVVDPVATHCGHLYCWPCLFRWLEPGMRPEELADLGIAPRRLAANPNRRKCPVCKSTCSVASIIPIYVRDSTESPSPSNDTFSSDEDKTTTDIHDANCNFDTVRSGTESPVDAFASAEATSTGLRRRNTRVSQEAQSSSNDHIIPSRPAATSIPSSNASISSSAANDQIPSNGYGVSGWADPIAPTTTRTHHGALTNSLIMSLQHVTANSTDVSDHVPSIHRRSGNHANSHSRRYVDEPPRTIILEYASRVLIMLTSFLVLYLLLT